MNFETRRVLEKSVDGLRNKENFLCEDGGVVGARFEEPAWIRRPKNVLHALKIETFGLPLWIFSMSKNTPLATLCTTSQSPLDPVGNMENGAIDKSSFWESGDKTGNNWSSVGGAFPSDQSGPINRIEIVKRTLFHRSRQTQPRRRNMNRLARHHRLSVPFRSVKLAITRIRFSPPVISSVTGLRTAMNWNMVPQFQPVPNGAAQNHIRAFPQFGHFHHEFSKSK